MSSRPPRRRQEKENRYQNEWLNQGIETRNGDDGDIRHDIDRQNIDRQDIDE
jgi:hypothetical protein